MAQAFDSTKILGAVEDAIIKAKADREEASKALTEIKKVLRNYIADPKAKGVDDETFDDFIGKVANGLKAVSELIVYYTKEILNSVQEVPKISTLEEPDTLEGSILRTESGVDEDSKMNKLVKLMRRKGVGEQGFKTVTFHPLLRLMQTVEMARKRWNDFIMYHREILGTNAILGHDAASVRDELDFLYAIETDLQRLFGEQFDVEIKKYLVVHASVTSAAISYQKAQLQAGK